MAENLISRVKRIIGGGANAFITAIEDVAPRTVLIEAITEVDRAYDDVRADLGKLVAQKHLTNRELMAKSGRHEDLGMQLATALQEKREDLAEAAVAKQLDIEAQIPILENSVAEIGEQEKELEGYMAALKAKKREMEDDLVLFDKTRKDADKVAVEGVEGLSAEGNTVRSVENASATFDRVLRDSTGVDLKREGMDAAALQELESLTRKNRIKERLEAVKSKMQDQQ